MDGSARSDPRGSPPPPERVARDMPRPADDRRSRSRSRSRSPRPRSRSPRSRSPPPRRRSRSYSRSPSPRRGGSRSRRYSRSPSPRRYRRRSYSRSPSPHDRRRYRRSPSPRYRGRWSPPRPRRPRASFDERERPPPCNVIGCFGLNPHTPEEMVREKFEKFGKISKVVLVKDRQTGLSRGFGFITYEDVADATDAVEKMNHTQLDDRNIRVAYSLTKREHSPTPGQYMGAPVRRGRSPSPRYRY
eukprot:m.72935 g.72935  ORF g.72935 m.72935 type:complete len:245 (-) comp8807_c0_seq4:725-1459(-)